MHFDSLYMFLLINTKIFCKKILKPRWPLLFEATGQRSTVTLREILDALDVLAES